MEDGIHCLKQPLGGDDNMIIVKAFHHVVKKGGPIDAGLWDCPPHRRHDGALRVS